MWAGEQCTPGHPFRVAGRLLSRLKSREAGHEEELRRTRGDAAGAKLGTDPVDRYVVNVGSVSGWSRDPTIQVGCGQVRRRLIGPGRGGAVVVVRGRESRSHGEGRQRVLNAGTGMAGDRRSIPACCGLSPKGPRCRYCESRPSCTDGRTMILIVASMTCSTLSTRGTERAGGPQAGARADLRGGLQTRLLWLPTEAPSP